MPSTVPKREASSEGLALTVLDFSGFTGNTEPETAGPDAKATRQEEQGHLLDKKHTHLQPESWGTSGQGLARAGRADRARTLWGQNGQRADGNRQLKRVSSQNAERCGDLGPQAESDPSSREMCPVSGQCCCYFWPTQQELRNGVLSLQGGVNELLLSCLGWGARALPGVHPHPTLHRPQAAMTGQAWTSRC